MMIIKPLSKWEVGRQLPPSRRWSLISPQNGLHTSCLAFKEENKEKEKLHSRETCQTPPPPHSGRSHLQWCHRDITQLLICDKGSSVQSLSRVWLLVAPWTAARQASLSTTNSWSLHKLMSIELVMSSNHLIPCRPLLLLHSIFPSIRVFSNESVLRIKRWSTDISASASVLPMNIQDWFPLGWTGWISLQSKGRDFWDTIKTSIRIIGVRRRGKKKEKFM